jgi:hypothetical protein
MTDARPISSEEAAVITAIVSTSGVPSGQGLINDLDGAAVSHSAPWILHIQPATEAPGVDLPDGPFPADAAVPNSANYQGEIIIWIKNGHLDGLEYAWVTDEPPTRWPRPDEMEISGRAASP